MGSTLHIRDRDRVRKLRPAWISAAARTAIPPHVHGRLVEIDPAADRVVDE
ncbi:hypothetical protein [Burkholderia stagnalis]|uniref:hypothetical protein n=1 Tax=Burkholderia stagnalis TaxID=1503054 RepID=UPI0012DA8625|nr:hypothetical protein [Burkholderia stagnalis]